MALGIIGSTSGAHAGSVSTTAMSFNYTIPAGSNRGAIVALIRGYNNDSNNVFPASLTYGGQTIARHAQAYAGGNSNGEMATYLLDETDIAAMSGNTCSVTFGDALAGSSVEVVYMVIAVADSNQTLVDSDVVTNNVSASPLSVTVTSASGNLVIVLGGVRADGTLSSQTGFTNITSANPGVGDLNDGRGRADYIVASAGTTDAEMVFTGDELAFLQAFVFAEDVAAPAVTAGSVRTVYVNDIA